MKEASSPGDPRLLFSISTCSSRKKRRWLSVISSQALRGLSGGPYLSCPGNLDMFLKEVFFLSVLTEAVWRWVTSSFLSLSLDLSFIASGSELLVCCAWLAFSYYLRIVW